MRKFKTPTCCHFGEVHTIVTSSTFEAYAMSSKPIVVVTVVALCALFPLCVAGQTGSGYRMNSELDGRVCDSRIISVVTWEKQVCFYGLSPIGANVTLASLNLERPTVEAESTKSVGFNVRDLRIEPYTGKRTKVIDRQFTAMSSLLILSFVADAETTIHGVAAGGHEINPILGRYPTSARIFEVGLPLTAAAIFLSYHYKSLYPERRWWKLYQGVPAGAHAFGAIYTLFELANKRYRSAGGTAK